MGPTIAIGLMVTNVAAIGGTPAPAAAITSLTIMDSTALDPDAGSIGIDGNGWVVKAIMPYIVGATFDPTKLLFTVRDPGYDNAKNVVTCTRFIQGGKNLRRQYSNDASLQVSNDGTTLTAYFSIEDDIYQGATLIQCQAATGFYGAAQAGAVSTIVNNSTRAYVKPSGGWVTPPGRRATGATFNPEFLATARHPMNGKQVACVEFIATDGTNSTSGVITDTPSLSAEILPPAADVKQPEVHKPSILLGALTQGAACTLNAKIYPWIGDSSAILDLAVDGVDGSTNVNCDTVLRFTNDKDGTWGGAIAYVKAGASGGVVSLNDATARATPYPTLIAALTAIQTFNNTSSAGHSNLHNDHGGSKIYLMDDGAGGAVAHGIGANLSTVAAGTCLTEIMVDPLATGAVSITLAASRATTSFLWWKVPILQGGNFGLTGGGTSNNIVSVFECPLTINGSTTPINYQNGLTYFRNMTPTGLAAAAGNPFRSNFATQRTQVASILGCVGIATADLGIVSPFIAGCDFQRMSLLENASGYTFHDTIDRQIIVNTRLRDCRAANVLGSVRPITKGLKMLQVVIERANTASIAALQIGADGTVQPVQYLDLEYVTIPGTATENRINWNYADVAGAVNIAKSGRARHCIFGPYNCKTDTFTTNTTLTGRVKNWRVIYGVGFRGIATTAPSTDGSTVPGYKAPTGNWLGEYWPANCKTGTASITFTDNKAGGAAATGLGTYTLTGASNDAYNRVASGEAGLLYDLAGIARLNDGTGAAGAYERTV